MMQAVPAGAGTAYIILIGQKTTSRSRSGGMNTAA